MKLNEVLTHAAMALSIALTLRPCMGQSQPHGRTSSSHSHFGSIPGGQAVEKVFLVNDLGMRVAYIDYACTITSMEVPDNNGTFKNIILNLPTLSDYLKTNRRYAAVIGRYAGRIAAGRYELGGKVYSLPTNPNGAALHSDPNGFDKRVWNRLDFDEPTSLGSVYTLQSPDGDQGHPGNVTVKVKYELMRKQNEFRITYQAVTDQATVMTLTNHAFMNLAGAGAHGLSTHLFQVLANEFVEVNDKKLPSGRLLPVNETALNLNQATNISRFLTEPSTLLGSPHGYDHTLVLQDNGGRLQTAVVVIEQESGRTLTIKTTEPAIQFNTGNGFNKEEIGGEGVAYDIHDGFAMETFHLPDSPNQAHFPSAVITAEKPLYSQTVYSFGTVIKR